LPVAGLIEAGPVEPHASADHVGADDEVPGRIERLARTDQPGPPAGLAVDRVNTGHVLVAGQGVADQDGVRAVGVQLAVGAVGDLEVFQLGAGVEPQGLMGREPPGSAFRQHRSGEVEFSHARLGPLGAFCVNRALPERPSEGYGGSWTD
jgi:hypothetical protein